MPTDQPLTPMWWVKRLYKQLTDRRADVDRFDAYYRGEPPNYPWLPAQAREEFARLLDLTRSNYMGLVVDATAERLQVEGFRIGDEREADRETWRIWQANNLDAESDQALLDALITGQSYLLIAPPDPDEPTTPYVYVEHASQAIVEYVPGTSRRERAAGLKVWEDDWTGKVCATLYLPDGVYKFVSDKPRVHGITTLNWVVREVPGERWPAPNPLGVVPLVELRNNPRTLCGGVSEIADVVSIQDRIAKTLADRLMTQDFGAFPQKWATGFPDADSDGNVNRVNIGRNRLVTSDVAETKFGQWDAAPLDPYSAAKREDVKDIASRTRTPAQYLLGELNNVNGQAICINTLVPTPRGLVRMGDICDGDEVYDERGMVQTVEQAHPVMHDRPCYRITFDDGAVFVADASHRWPVVSIPESKRHLPSNATRTARSIMNTEDIAASVRCANGQWTHAIDLAGAPDGPDVDLPVDPYVLGVYLGNGCKTNGTIAAGFHDRDAMLELLREAGEEPTSKDKRTCAQITCHRTDQNKSLRGRLVEAGVLGDKHIPEAYFRASFKQRLALLQGVMDTDGSPIKRQAGAVELSLADERLARDVHRMICSLGHKVRLTIRTLPRSGFGAEPTMTKCNMRWHPLDPVFRLPRKAEVLAARRPTNRPKTLRRTIVSVEPVESVPVRCLTVTGPSHLYLIGVEHVPTHNTLKAAESGLVSKVAQRMRSFGEDLETAVRLMRVAANLPNADASTETIWRNPEHRTEGELVDALLKMSTLGVPQEVLWERWGATQVEISRWKEINAEAEAQGLAQLFKQPAGGPTPPTGVKPPQPPLANMPLNPLNTQTTPRG